jgi:cytoskeletal protein RodZ
MPYQYQTKPQVRKKRKFLSKRVLIVLLLLCLVTGIVVALELTNTTHLFHKKAKPAITASSETKGESGAPNSTNSPNNKSSNSKVATPQQTNQSEPGDEKSTTSGDTSGTLIDPTGNFVSNHHAKLNSIPGANAEQSTCTSTPGAACQIIFTKDGVTKSLPAQTTDRGGSTYWTWKIQDIGLTEGTWHIQAKTTLGNQTKTANDALDLEVQT